MDTTIPELSKKEIESHFLEAKKTSRRRSPLILHEKGDYLNKVFNFILKDSYMHPHLHPSDEKVENMYLIKGSFGLIEFDDKGNINKTTVLNEHDLTSIKVPAYTWHTYVMLSEENIVYETMEGKYEPDTWKRMAPWAPQEESNEAPSYLQKLKNNL
jgi:cupin fold WbuC family metalloprotein